MISNEASHKCPICHSSSVAFFLEIPEVPVFCNFLLSSEKEALETSTGTLKLGFCRACCHVFNAAFRPALLDYSGKYENSLHFSSTFHDYAQTLAQRLVQRYHLYGKTIVEIGCGNGDFLKLLCKMGNNRGIGFDPSYPADANENLRCVQFIRDFYSDKYKDLQADFICSRHTLEHVPDPKSFLRDFRESIQPNAIVYFEVPNARFIFSDLSVWDLIYEHYSYFNRTSLVQLFMSCGFATSDLSESYEGQYLYIEAIRNWEDLNWNISHFLPSTHEQLEDEIIEFPRKYQIQLEFWRHALTSMSHRRIVLWGAGSKGVMFLNLLQIKDEIKFVVDVNPRKQGMFIPGTGQQIVPCEFLLRYKPEVVILMNPIYKAEIKETLRELGLKPDFLTLSPVH